MESMAGRTFDVDPLAFATAALGLVVGQQIEPVELAAAAGRRVEPTKDSLEVAAGSHSCWPTLVDWSQSAVQY